MLAKIIEQGWEKGLEEVAQLRSLFNFREILDPSQAEDQSRSRREKAGLLETSPAHIWIRTITMAMPERYGFSEDYWEQQSW